MSILDRIRRPALPAGVTARPFECSRDGLTIRGTEYRPATDAACPIAVVCHGFMAFQDTVRQYAALLAGLGYAAYTFDFCGGSVIKGQSDGATTAMSVRTEVRDLEAVLDHVRALPGNDPERLLLMGCSQGGLVAALVAAGGRFPVEKLVLFYPALCIPDDARAGRMMLARFDPDHIPDTLRCGPMKLGRCYVEDVIGMDPYAEIAGYRGPVLLVHGTRDRIVAPAYSRRAKALYGDRAALHWIRGGGHGFSAAHDAEAMELLRTFARL